MKQCCRWIPVVLWAIIIWQLTTVPDFKVSDDTVLSLIISSGGHVFFFGIQAALLFLAFPTRIWNLSSSIPSAAISSLYGFIIELVQRSVPGRSADPLDWILDTLGAITFLAIMKKLINKKTRI